MNEQIFHFFNSFAGQNWLVDKAVVFLAQDLPYLLIGGIAVFLVMHKDKKKGARDLAVVVTAAAAAWVVARGIKYFFPHARPSTLPDTYVLLTPDDNQSFPSGHATFFSALAAALYFYHKRIAFWYAIGALLIGLGRIIGGIHWPVDIFAGYILGGLIGGAVYWFYQTKSSKA